MLKLVYNADDVRTYGKQDSLASLKVRLDQENANLRPVQSKPLEESVIFREDDLDDVFKFEKAPA